MGFASLNPSYGCHRSTAARPVGWVERSETHRPGDSSHLCGMGRLYIPSHPQRAAVHIEQCLLLLHIRRLLPADANKLP